MQKLLGLSHVQFLLVKSHRKAFLWMLFQLLAAALILFTFNSLAITLGLVALIPVAIYPLQNALLGGLKYF